MLWVFLFPYLLLWIGLLFSYRGQKLCTGEEIMFRKSSVLKEANVNPHENNIIKFVISLPDKSLTIVFLLVVAVVR